MLSGAARGSHCSLYYPLLYSVHFLFLCLPASTSTQSTGREPCIFYCPSFATLWPRTHQHMVRAKTVQVGFSQIALNWISLQSLGWIQVGFSQIALNWISLQSLPRNPCFPKSWVLENSRLGDSRDAILRKQGEFQIFYFPYKATRRFSRQEKNGCCYQRPWANRPSAPTPPYTL